ncbi:MAG: thioredoxin [Bacilli bacterium]
MAVINANVETFKDVTSEGVALVDFWAPWCGPCKMLAPVLDELAEDLGETAKIVKVNVDENQAIAGQFGVMSIPALFVLKNGEVVGQAVGYKPKEALAELIEEHL